MVVVSGDRSSLRAKRHSAQRRDFDCNVFWSRSKGSDMIGLCDAYGDRNFCLTTDDLNPVETSALCKEGYQDAVQKRISMINARKI